MSNPYPFIPKKSPSISCSVIACNILQSPPLAIWLMYSAALGIILDSLSKEGRFLSFLSFLSFDFLGFLLFLPPPFRQ